jgi:hypothetical protein
MFLKGNARYLRLAPDGEQDESPEVECVPVGLEKLTYLKIGLALNRQAHLHEFPYDWRRPIEYNADLLSRSIQRWADGDSSRKFTLVAHSMGGLVSRVFLARHPQIAQQHVKRVILHGTPNFGATNAVDTLVNGNSMMATADRLNDRNAMRTLVYCLPSVYQLLPAPQACFPSGRDYPVDFDLYQAAEWPVAAVQQKYLDGARALQERLAGSDPQIPIDIINGCHIETQVRVRKSAADGSAGLVLETEAQGPGSGDGTVPLWSSQLPGARWFYVQEVHRNLMNNGQAIRATLDLILSGDCSLPTHLPAKKAFSFGAVPPVSFDPTESELRAKIESGSAGRQDLERLFFAF